MSEEESFEGAVEVEKVGFDYNSLFPDELGRAYEREHEVERLGELLYNANNIPVAIIGPEGRQTQHLKGSCVPLFIQTNPR